MLNLIPPSSCLHMLTSYLFATLIACRMLGGDCFNHPQPSAHSLANVHQYAFLIAVLACTTGCWASPAG